MCWSVGSEGPPSSVKCWNARLNVLKPSALGRTGRHSPDECDIAIDSAVKAAWSIFIAFAVCPTMAQSLPASVPLPTNADAAQALSEHITDICIQAIDVCDPEPTRPDPNEIEKLRCWSKSSVAVCRFQWPNYYKCRARFVRSAEAAGGWLVAKHPRLRFYSDVRCRD